MFASLEESLANGDWDAVAATTPVEPEVTPDDELELLHLIAEADRIQRLISSYMTQVSHELELSPQLRKAATAYTRGGGVIS